MAFGRSLGIPALFLAGACTNYAIPSPRSAAGPPGLEAASAAHYEAYGAALAAHRRGSIAGFYHHDGALIVFNGVPRRQSRAELQRRYEGPWSPPDYFAWENLAFDSIAPGKAIVTGGFRWQAAGQRDTARYIYAGVVVATDSGMGIIFEHETLRPPPPSVAPPAAAPAPRDFDAEITAAIREATITAGRDYPLTVLDLCHMSAPFPVDTIDAPRPAARTAAGFRERPRESWYAEPARVFDDLYFVGDIDQSAWALTTAEGIILIDTNIPFRTETVLLEGMRKVGLNPRDVRYVIVSHAHGDHLGGAKVLQERFGARIVMSEVDWQRAESSGRQ